MAQPARRRWSSGFAAALAGGLCLLHGLGIWVGLGGREGLLSPWPLARHDHPLYFHSALVTRAFLRQSGTTAGYDPSFMAGYAKSIIFPASSTLPELSVALFGGERPVLAYKLYLLLSVAAVPWLIRTAARRIAGSEGWARIGTVGLFLIYVWTDFPIHYASYGMVPYLLAIPLGLAALGSLTELLTRGRRRDVLAAAAGCWAAVLVHFTVAMVLAPAVLAAYAARLARSPRFSWGQQAGFWAVPVAVLVGNVFWWWPGPWLAATKGASSFAFAHPEGVIVRLGKIFTVEPSIQAVLWALGVPGLMILARQNPVAGAGLGMFAAAGFGWGYAAGAARELDFLQPGRHTFALYSGLCVAAGPSLAILLGPSARRLRTLAVLAGLAVLLRGSGVALVESIAVILGDPLPGLTRATSPELAARLRVVRPEPFLSSRPPALLRWVVQGVRQTLRPGERLLYEEGGFAVPGLAEPFGEGRYSGLIPYFAPGVEVVGGPYLHAALTTNFTQFGEGRLFGKSDWTRADFIEHARLYRPAAILCWSPHARDFCRRNSDLITVVEENGRMLLGRVRGYEGATIRGEAEVTAAPGWLRVRRSLRAELDDPVVLRYHFVPHLRAEPSVRLEPVYEGDDPVPFIALRPPAGGVTIRMRIPPTGR